MTNRERKLKRKILVKEFKPVILKIKRYLYYEKKITLRVSISNKDAIDLFLKDQNLKVDHCKRQFLVNLSKSGKNEVLNKRCIRKPRRKKKDFRREYDNYLRTPEWREKREELFLLRGKKCEKCGSTKQIEVHHLHYKNIFNEKMEDLQVLCKPCHIEEHRILKIKKNQNKNTIKYKRNGVLKIKQL